jgi:hypothetical protein
LKLKTLYIFKNWGTRIRTLTKWFRATRATVTLFPSVYEQGLKVIINSGYVNGFLTSSTTIPPSAVGIGLYCPSELGRCAAGIGHNFFHSRHNRIRTGRAVYALFNTIAKRLFDKAVFAAVETYYANSAAWPQTIRRKSQKFS